MQQYDYDRYFSPFYKWIIAPGGAAGTYRLYPVVSWNTPELSQ